MHNDPDDLQPTNSDAQEKNISFNSSNSDWQESSRRKFARIISGYTAIIFIIPYLFIKIAWILGIPIGMSDSRMISNPVMITFNILSFSMDVIAVLLALTFSHRWGRKVYCWLVLFPIWVGIGFLTPIIMATPLQIMLSLLQSDPNLNVTAGQSILAPRVRSVVFSSFVGQGIALITAFVLYVLARWNHIMKLRSSDTPPFSVAIIRSSRFAFVMAVLVASLHLSWAFGASLGFPDELLRGRASNFYVFHLVFGILPLFAAIGIISLSNKLIFKRVITPLIFCWIGAGSMFSWGSWLVLGDVLKGSNINSIGGPTITTIVMALTGLIIAMVMRAMLIGMVNMSTK